MKISSKAPELHPLAGARLEIFLRYLRLSEWANSRSRYQRFNSCLAQCLRFPFSCMETLRYRKSIRWQTLEKPPIFIIGHWRSGTTHLHNMMSQDSQFGYLSFSEAAMPLNMLGASAKIFRWFMARELPKDRGFDHVQLSLDDPQEEEMALANLNLISYFSVYYLPNKLTEQRDRALFFEGCRKEDIDHFGKCYDHLVRKLNLVKKGRQLLFKNPASTLRMQMILKLYSHAKFIHIVRNPWEVYCSTRDHFHEIFRLLAWQSYGHIDFADYSIETYEKFMSRYLYDRDRLNLPAHQLVETTYESITENPLEEIGRIYDELELDGKLLGLKKVEDYLVSLGQYERNAHRIDSEEIDQVLERWKFSFDAWDYPSEIPSTISRV